jgi:hypothetical protein
MMEAVSTSETSVKLLSDYNNSEDSHLSEIDFFEAGCRKLRSVISWKTQKNTAGFGKRSSVVIECWIHDYGHDILLLFMAVTKQAVHNLTT